MGPVPHACWTWSRGAPRRFQGLAPGPRIAASRCPNDADPTCSASSSGAPSTASATMPSLSAPPLIATSSLSPASVVAAPTTAPSECSSPPACSSRLWPAPLVTAAWVEESTDPVSELAPSFEGKLNCEADGVVLPALPSIPSPAARYFESALVLPIPGRHLPALTRVFVHCPEFSGGC